MKQFPHYFSSMLHHWLANGTGPISLNKVTGSLGMYRTLSGRAAKQQTCPNNQLPSLNDTVIHSCCFFSVQLADQFCNAIGVLQQCAPPASFSNIQTAINKDQPANPTEGALHIVFKAVMAFLFTSVSTINSVMCSRTV